MIKTVLILIMAMSLSAISTATVAAEPASTAAVNTSEVVGHIEKGLVEVSKSDFSAARVHLKAARAASEKLPATEATKKAYDALIQGQIQAQKGIVDKATELLKQAVVLYKAI